MKGILDHSFISETFIFFAYCVKLSKKVSNALVGFWVFCLDINLKKY